MCEEEQVKEVTRGFAKKIRELVKEKDELKVNNDNSTKEIA